MVSFLSAIFIVLALIAAVITAAYYGGVLDDLLAPFVVYLFKAKAKGELRALQAQGQKAGVDFMKGNYAFAANLDDDGRSPPLGQLTGDKQAEQIKRHGLAGLKNI